MVRTRPLLRIAATLLLAAVALLPSARASAQIGSLWDSGNIGTVIALGDIDPAAGLDALVHTPLAAVGVVRLEAGPQVEELPSPFNVFNNTKFYLRDLDGDGLAEILAIAWRPDNSCLLGALDVDSRGRVQRLWPDILLGNGFYDLAGEARLSPAEPGALILVRADLQIVSPATGAVIYASGNDPADGGRQFSSLVIEDFNGDGNEELLCEFEGNTSQFTTHLIGETGLSAAADFTRLGLSMGKGMPNPAAGPTRIAFEVPREGTASLRTYDVAGRAVRTLLEGRMAEGPHQAFWDGRDGAGQRVASGIYFYELKVGAERVTRKSVQVR